MDNSIAVVDIVSMAIDSSSSKLWLLLEDVENALHPTFLFLSRLCRLIPLLLRSILGRFVFLSPQQSQDIADGCRRIARRRQKLLLLQLSNRRHVGCELRFLEASGHDCGQHDLSGTVGEAYVH